MKKKIKIFRNNTDSSLENDINTFLNKIKENLISINYLATSNRGHISIIIEYKDN